MTNNSNNNGHREPPKEHQFKKGQSGNRSGRPKKKVNEQASDFDILFDQTISINKDGSSKELSAEEIMQHQIFNDAMAGVSKAIRTVFKWLQKREKYFEKIRAKQKPPEPKMRFEELNPDNINEVMDMLDIAHTVSIKGRCDALLLEPWAVEYSLKNRRGGTKLTAPEVEWLKITTRDYQSVKWPSGTHYN